MDGLTGACSVCQSTVEVKLISPERLRAVDQKASHYGFEGEQFLYETSDHRFSNRDSGPWCDGSRTTPEAITPVRS